MNKILVIAAHPDDEVLGMGGTIAKLAAQGCEVNVLIVTDGSSSQYSESANLAEIIEAKKQETWACARTLGVKNVYYGELPDMKLDTVPHITINKVIESVIDQLQPDTVFTHFWGDVNQDHVNVYKSTMVAVRPVQGQGVKELYCYRVPSSTEWTPCKGDSMFMPNCFVDISDFAQQKYEAFGKYATELRNYPHPRSVQHLQELDVAHGLEVGMGSTETFVLLRKLD
ncbi:MAG: PIG-L family deacetylase [Bacteroidales bacterium]|nr:PIG-L family deacetylase [Candidatus Colimorpha onthohippi]